jgi:hypothetical protein
VLAFVPNRSSYWSRVARMSRRAIQVTGTAKATMNRLARHHVANAIPCRWATPATSAIGKQHNRTTQDHHSGMCRRARNPLYQPHPATRLRVGLPLPSASSTTAARQEQNPPAVHDLGMPWFKRRSKPDSFEIDDVAVTRTRRGTVVEQVRWADLRSVKIVTTAAGPFADDVFFVLETASGGCVVPQSAASDAFVVRLQALPGFDNEQMIRAMGSAEDAEFLCWRSAQRG